MASLFDSRRRHASNTPAGPDRPTIDAADADRSFEALVAEYVAYHQAAQAQASVARQACKPVWLAPDSARSDEIATLDSRRAVAVTVAFTSPVAATLAPMLASAGVVPVLLYLPVTAAALLGSVAYAWRLSGRMNCLLAAERGGRHLRVPVSVGAAYLDFQCAVCRLEEAGDPEAYAAVAERRAFVDDLLIEANRLCTEKPTGYAQPLGQVYQTLVQIAGEAKALLRLVEAQQTAVATADARTEALLARHPEPRSLAGVAARVTGRTQMVQALTDAAGDPGAAEGNSHGEGTGGSRGVR